MFFLSPCFVIVLSSLAFHCFIFSSIKMIPHFNLLWLKSKACPPYISSDPFAYTHHTFSAFYDSAYFVGLTLSFLYLDAFLPINCNVLRSKELIIFSPLLSEYFASTGRTKCKLFKSTSSKAIWFQRLEVDYCQKKHIFVV